MCGECVPFLPVFDSENQVYRTLDPEGLGWGTLTRFEKKKSFGGLDMVVHSECM